MAGTRGGGTLLLNNGEPGRLIETFRYTMRREPYGEVIERFEPEDMVMLDQRVQHRATRHQTTSSFISLTVRGAIPIPESIIVDPGATVRILGITTTIVLEGVMITIIARKSQRKIPVTLVHRLLTDVIVIVCVLL